MKWNQINADHQTLDNRFFSYDISFEMLGTITFQPWFEDLGQW